MGTSRNDDGTDKRTSRSDDSVLYIWRTLADTTWRLFVPTVGGTMLGVWADSAWSTKPWLMIAGIVVGALGAFVLVRLQLTKKN